jgi:hypothetical protein
LDASRSIRIPRDAVSFSSSVLQIAHLEAQIDGLLVVGEGVGRENADCQEAVNRGCVYIVNFRPTLIALPVPNDGFRSIRLALSLYNGHL